jgi:hypothetical protein
MWRGFQRLRGLAFWQAAGAWKNAEMGNESGNDSGKAVPCPAGAAFLQARHHGKAVAQPTARLFSMRVIPRYPAKVA